MRRSYSWKLYTGIGYVKFQKNISQLDYRPSILGYLNVGSCAERRAREQNTEKCGEADSRGHNTVTDWRR